MQSCPCSIFDVREEQILEANGSLCVRLICNVCSTVLDSKSVRDGEVGPHEMRRRGEQSRRIEPGDDYVMEVSG